MTASRGCVRPGTQVATLGPVNERDVHMRREVYRQFVESGCAPTRATLAPALELTEADADASLRRLHDAHQIVLEPRTLSIRKLLPFSCEPSPHRVQAGGRAWYANCAWDAFGIPAALGTDGHVHSSCPCCAEAIEIEVRGTTPFPDGDVVHLLVPAEHWWDDIFYT